MLSCKRCFMVQRPIWRNDVYITAILAGNGHLNCLQQAREYGCEWDWTTTSYAAAAGHFECLKWAHENGCEWNYLTTGRAASDGHFECLKWAREKGCEWNSWATLWAAENGHLKILRWASDHGCPKALKICTIMFDGCMLINCLTCTKWTNSKRQTELAIESVNLVLKLSMPRAVLNLLTAFVCEIKTNCDC